MFFKELPEEIIFTIFNKTSFQDQARLAQVNKHFNRIVKDEALDLAKYKLEKLAIALKKAVLSNNPAKVKVLLSIGADPNHIYDSPLNPSKVESCFRGQKKTLLDFAIKLNSYLITVLLLQYKADINRMDEDGNTPLHKAAVLLRPRIAKLLIDNGAHVNALNHRGETPAYLAKQINQINQINLNYYNYYKNKINQPLATALVTNTGWEQAFFAEGQSYSPLGTAYKIQFEPSKSELDREEKLLKMPLSTRVNSESSLQPILYNPKLFHHVSNSVPHNTSTSPTVESRKNYFNRCSVI